MDIVASYCSAQHWCFFFWCMCRLCCEQVRIIINKLFGLLEGECNSLEQPLPPVLILLPYLDWCLQNLCKGLKEFVCVCSILFQRSFQGWRSMGWHCSYASRRTWKPLLRRSLPNSQVRKTSNICCILSVILFSHLDSGLFLRFIIWLLKHAQFE
jgi:hypothetical protein